MRSRKKRIVEIELAGYRRQYKFYPVTKDVIKNALKKMQDKTGVKTSQELNICEAAFMAAGIERAHDLNVTNVRPRHLLEGYDERFRFSMQHPRYQCMPRSVLGRTAQLRARSAVFDTLMNRLDE